MEIAVVIHLFYPKTGHPGNRTRCVRQSITTVIEIQNLRMVLSGEIPSSSALRAPSLAEEEKGWINANCFLSQTCLHATLSSSGGEDRVRRFINSTRDIGKVGFYSFRSITGWPSSFAAVRTPPSALVLTIARTTPRS